MTDEQIRAAWAADEIRFRETEAAKEAEAKRWWALTEEQRDAEMEDFMASLDDEVTLPAFARQGESVRDALTRAVAEGGILCSSSDPAADGRQGLTVDEAAAIATEDPTLIYVADLRLAAVARARDVES